MDVGGIDEGYAAYVMGFFMCCERGNVEDMSEAAEVFEYEESVVLPSADFCTVEVVDFEVFGIHTPIIHVFGL